MNVGDLVVMNFDGWSGEEIANYGGWQGWGIGVIIELPPDSRYDRLSRYCHVNWSKVGPSWETIDELEKINER